MSYQAITSVTTIVVGQQECQTYTSNRAHEKNLQLQTPGTWVTCLDLHAVISHAYAWGTARGETNYLPAALEIHSTDRLFASSAIVRHRGFTAPQVFRSAGERDYLEVIVGPLRTRAYDQAAVESLAQAWDRALLLARTMWSGEEPRTNPESITKVMKNRGMPPILHKGIPTEA